VAKEPVITQQLDDLVVMKLPNPMFTYPYEPGLASLVLYEHYEDKFDVIFVLYNMTRREAISRGLRDWGAVAHVSNYVEGIGVPSFTKSKRFGSDGRLKIVVRLITRNGLLFGPSLHSLIHAWTIGEVIPTMHPGHWGFSSVHGQLGGFNREELKDLGDGKYSAGRFGLIGNFGNTIPYSPLELYLAGWLPSEDVPEILVAIDAVFIEGEEGQERDEEGNPIFKSEGFKTITIDEIIEILGPRNPAVGEARDALQAAVILLEDEGNEVTPKVVDEVRNTIQLFSATEDIRPENTSSELINFWMATGGRATITMDGLDDLQLPKDKESEETQPSSEEAPTAHQGISLP